MKKIPNLCSRITRIFLASCIRKVASMKTLSTKLLSTPITLTVMLLTLSSLATALTSLTSSTKFIKVNLTVKRISLDISLTNVMTLTRCWVVFHFTSTTMLSLAICLYAITSSIMGMFSKDKSIANNKKSAADWLPILL